MVEKGRCGPFNVIVGGGDEFKFVEYPDGSFLFLFGHASFKYFKPGIAGDTDLLSLSL